MGKLTLEKSRSFSSFHNTPLKWPNSVSAFEDGRVAIADAGNNRVCIFSHDGEALWEHNPGAGFGDQKLREPIFVGVSPDQYLFVSDWHNHRFLVFDPDLNFSHTLFHLGAVKQASLFFRFELFVKHLLTRSVGAPYYFSFDKMNGVQPKKADYSLRMLFRGLGHYLCRPQAAINILFDRTLAVRKPNGIVFQGEELIITQKANRCVSAYTVKEAGYHGVSLKKHVSAYPDGLNFGRLCNLTRDTKGNFYVCDQNNWRICVLDKDLNYERHIDFEERADVPMGPFGCAIIDDQYIVAAKSFGIEIKRLSDGETLYERQNMGETHGIFWDPVNRYLYYVDRSNSRIEQFKVMEGA